MIVKISEIMIAKILSKRTIPEEPVKQASDQAKGEDDSKKGSFLKDFLWGTRRRQGMVETMAKQTARTVGSQIGRQIFRGILGGILGGSKKIR